ncbi:unnamed protein product, partial [Thlaspi arvense]
VFEVSRPRSKPRFHPFASNLYESEALVITLEDYRITTLPFNFFTSKTLVNLRIGTRIRFRAPWDSVSPMLSSLVLESVAFSDAKLGYEPILSAFPSLQNLRIRESNKWYYWNGSISSPTLKKLVYRRDDETSAPKTSVSFDTRSLVYLDYSDVVADKYEDLHLDSLVEVRLDLLLTANQIMRKTAPDNIGFLPGDVTALFMGIRNVKILCLTPDALETLYYRVWVFLWNFRKTQKEEEEEASPFLLCARLIVSKHGREVYPSGEEIRMGSLAAGIRLGNWLADRPRKKFMLASLKRVDGAFENHEKDILQVFARALEGVGGSEDDMVGNATTFIMGISNVTTLSLSAHTLEDSSIKPQINAETCACAKGRKRRTFLLAYRQVR